MNTPPIPKVRVTVPVSQEVLDRFKRLSQVSGQSVGRAMGEWLEETQIGLDPLIDMIEYHKRAPRKAVQSLQAYSAALHDMTGDLFDKVAHMDEGAEQLASASAAARLVVHRVREKGLTPPSSNTGGKGRGTPQKPAGGPK